MVVDTGSGTVWSACISFSGSTSGIGALDLASGVIPGLSPTYDVYAGEGRAVCKLLGVGNNPPDCLGKTVQYWGYFHNGRYSGSGAGAVTVHDGDVESWRWGTSGATPRRAGAGSEAVASPPPTTTTPPTTRPTAPPPPSPSGSMSGSVPAPTGQTPQAGAPTAGSSPGTPVGSSTTAPVTVAGGAAASSTTVAPARPGPGSKAAAGAKRERSASATEQAFGPSPVAPSAGATGSASGDSSGWTSAATFGLVLAAIIGIGLFLRSRRPSPA